RVGLEVDVAPTVALASPQQGTPAHLIAAKPIEPPHLSVRRILVRSPPVEVDLVEGVIPLEHGKSVPHRPRGRPAVRKIPGRLGRVQVIADVFDVLAPLEQEHTQALLSQLLGSPSAGYSGAH